jgi:hypothetical protein
MVVITTHLVTHSGVRDIFITEEDKFALVATFGGVDVVNLYTGNVVSSGIIPGGYLPLCITADWTTSSGLIYVGTSGGGIFSTRYHFARTPGSDFSGSLTAHYSTATPTPTSSDVIRDLDMKNGKLFAATSSGVDVIFVRNNRKASRVLASGAFGVHLTSSGGGYWTTTDKVEVKYDLLSSTGTGIIGTDFAYTVTSVPQLPGPGVFDMAVSEAIVGTALAFATPSGVLVTEEAPFVESTADSKIFNPPNEAEETPTPLFISVDFSPRAAFNSGLLYATTTGTLRVYDLGNNSLVGTHPQEFDTIYNFTGGIARDQLLATGVVNIVRTTAVL